MSNLSIKEIEEEAETLEKFCQERLKELKVDFEANKIGERTYLRKRLHYTSKLDGIHTMKSHLVANALLKELAHDD